MMQPAAGEDFNADVAANLPSLVGAVNSLTSQMANMAAMMADQQEQITLLRQERASARAPTAAPGFAPAAVHSHASSDDADDFSYAASEDSGLGELRYVPNYADNLHARAVQEGGDVYEEPQMYNMYRDHTHDQLAKKPKGTLFEAYRTVEPMLRYISNAIKYIDEVSEAAVDDSPALRALDRVGNTLDGVYSILNQYVGSIHMRAHFGDSMTPGEREKLTWIKSKMREDDYLPASLHPRIRELSEQFDRSLGRAELSALARSAARDGAQGHGTETSRRDRDDDGGGRRSYRDVVGPGVGRKPTKGVNISTMDGRRDDGRRDGGRRDDSRRDDGRRGEGPRDGGRRDDGRRDDGRRDDGPRDGGRGKGGKGSGKGARDQRGEEPERHRRGDDKARSERAAPRRQSEPESASDSEGGQRRGRTALSRVQTTTTTRRRHWGSSDDESDDSDGATRR